MKRYRRPPEPADFSAKVRRAREKAEEFVEAQFGRRAAKKSRAGASKSARGGGRKGAAGGGKKVEVFGAAWRDYKAVFASAQFGKCGFCESNILKTGRGDVEHYRPKSEVSALEAHGRGREAAAGVRQRLTKALCPTGYYWLAYDWSNYLLSCAICNQDYKGSIFPVKNDPRALPPRKDSPDEDALLLNPYGDREPARHLEFTRDGFVREKNRSPYGRATIETCGLYRDPLIRARQAIAVRVYDAARDLRRPPRQRRDSSALRTCYEHGCDDAEHCGMARAIIEQVGGLTWEELVRQRATELARQLKRARDPEEVEELEEQMERMGTEVFEHSGAVREIFERTCRDTWAALVARRARTLSRRLLADRRYWQDREYYELGLKKKIYLLARDNPAHAASVRQAYERHARMDWGEMKRLVETREELLWKLDDA